MAVCTNSIFNEESEVFSGFDTLLTRDITKSSATQRAGRAGREVRLYSYVNLLQTLNWDINRVQAYVSDYTLKKHIMEWLRQVNRRFSVVVSHQVFSTLNASVKTWKI